MTNEPNNEQARELSEKELEGIAGGMETYKGIDIVDDFKVDVRGGIPDGVTYNPQITVALPDPALACQ